MTTHSGASPAPATDRESRVHALSAALVGAQATLRRIRITFDARDVEIGDCVVELDDLPGGRVSADVRVELRIVAETTLFLKRNETRRDLWLRSHGWDIDRRRWEVEPSDRTQVGTVADEIQELLEISGALPDIGWVVRVEADAPSDGIPPDETWFEGATAYELGERLRALAALRGGRVLVRHTTGDGPVIALTTHRRGHGVEVRAKNLGVLGEKAVPWRHRWSDPNGLPRSTTIMESVEAALARLSVHDVDAEVSVRLETAADRRGWKADDYAFVVAWFIAAGVVAVPLVVLAAAGQVTVPLLVVLVIGWLGGMSGAYAGATVARRFGDRRNWRYDSTLAAEVLLGAIVGAAAMAALLLIANSVAWPS
jgi:hypothetical protein